MLNFPSPILILAMKLKAVEHYRELVCVWIFFIWYDRRHKLLASKSHLWWFIVDIGWLGCDEASQLHDVADVNRVDLTTLGLSIAVAAGVDIDVAGGWNAKNIWDKIDWWQKQVFNGCEYWRLACCWRLRSGSMSTD